MSPPTPAARCRTDWTGGLGRQDALHGAEIAVCSPGCMPDDLPTPRTTLRAGYVRVVVWCKACKHQREADLPALVDAGKGDVPLRELRWRRANCGSRLTDFVLTGGAEVRLW